MLHGRAIGPTGLDRNRTAAERSRELQGETALDLADNPARLHERFCRELEQLQQRAQELGVSPDDADDARYALAALIDEAAVQEDGPLRDYWSARLLQMRLFSENVAGENFFERLAALRGDRKRVLVLRVYYLCLLFGFRGKYRLRGSELELLEIEEGVRGELQRAGAIPSELVLSPSGRRPYEKLADGRRNQLLVTLAGVAACLSVLAYVGLRLALVHRSDQLLEQVAGLLGV